jgi:solute carrier family 25 phosphate transporter 3
MSSLFPSQHALQQTFGWQRRASSGQAEARPVPATSKATPRQARPELYSAAYSVVDDTKKKLSTEAQKEFDKASSAAKAKTGQIELYSAGFYAAATFGGLMACVSIHYSSLYIGGD